MKQGVDEGVDYEARDDFEEMAFALADFGTTRGGGEILDADDDDTNDAKKAHNDSQNVCQENKIILVRTIRVNKITGV